jgi:hypothetical protein
VLLPHFEVMPLVLDVLLRPTWAAIVLCWLPLQPGLIQRSCLWFRFSAALPLLLPRAG